MRSFIQAAFFGERLEEIRRAAPKIGRARGPVQHCDCGRKLWSTTEESNGRCATCQHAKRSEPATLDPRP